MLGAHGLHIGDAEGEAEFVPSLQSSVLHYKETGRLRLSAGGQVVAFSRKFGYTITGDIVDVAFADGVQAGQAYQRYRYDPERQLLAPVQSHLCRLDLYNGNYTLTGQNRFDLQTRIEGPHKDYALQTHFTRTTDSTSA